MEENKYIITFRYNNTIEKTIQEVMLKQDCDKSTAIRMIIQYFIEMGGINLIQ